MPVVSQVKNMPALLRDVGMAPGVLRHGLPTNGIDTSV